MSYKDDLKLINELKKLDKESRYLALYHDAMQSRPFMFISEKSNITRTIELIRLIDYICDSYLDPETISCMALKLRYGLHTDEPIGYVNIMYELRSGYHAWTIRSRIDRALCQVNKYINDNYFILKEAKTFEEYIKLNETLAEQITKAKEACKEIYNKKLKYEIFIRIASRVSADTLDINNRTMNSLKYYLYDHIAIADLYDEFIHLQTNLPNMIGINKTSLNRVYAEMDKFSNEFGLTAEDVISIHNDSKIFTKEEFDLLYDDKVKTRDEIFELVFKYTNSISVPDFVRDKGILFIFTQVGIQTLFDLIRTPEKNLKSIYGIGKQKIETMNYYINKHLSKFDLDKEKFLDMMYPND